MNGFALAHGPRRFLENQKGEAGRLWCFLSSLIMRFYEGIVMMRIQNQTQSRLPQTSL
jgi:hypothetical protein